MTQTEAETDRIVADVRYVETLISQHLGLQATSHAIHVHETQVSVEVMGAHHEAYAWRAAINGRILPAHIDIHGVRRQVVLGKRVSVNVVENPYPQRFQVLVKLDGTCAVMDSSCTYGQLCVTEPSLDRAFIESIAAEMNFRCDREAGIR